MIPPELEAECQNGKPSRFDEAAPAIGFLSPPSAIRGRELRTTRAQTPPSFWDNLSRVPLCRRALREFDRRTAQSVHVTSTTQLLEDQLTHVKRFARHGGPNLRDIRGVSPTCFTGENTLKLP